MALDCRCKNKAPSTTPFFHFNLGLSKFMKGRFRTGLLTDFKLTHICGLDESTIYDEEPEGNIELSPERVY
jgi:hypothetical protein